MRYLILLFSLCYSYLSFGQEYRPTVENLAAREAFQDAKFGLFIHWGASSVLGQGEWVMNVRGIRINDYKQLLDIFYPYKFDAKQWVSMAKNAGMKYITFITRHHDGFSNWDTHQSDLKITNTPYAKDVLKALADECHQQDMKLFLYYSLVDWYHEDYQYETGKTGKASGRTKKSQWSNYLAFMKAQMSELLTQYGKIDGIWLDGHWDQLDNDHDKSLKSKVDWKYEEFYKMIHDIQPHCLISNNHHLAPIQGEDFQAFEKDLPGGNTTGFGGQSISTLPLETCETMNNSWGFNITDRNFKSSKALIHYMIKAAGHNANFLLNVGPRPDGSIQPQFVDTLKVIGSWMSKYGESYYQTRGVQSPSPSWGTLTQKSNIYYAHILEPSQVEEYIFVPIKIKKIKDCIVLNSGTKLRNKIVEEGVFIYLDGHVLDPIDTVIKILVK